MVLKDRRIEGKAFLNENIPFSRILLISEDGKEKQETTRIEALKQAKNFGLDLLCVNPSANPPVCKLVNYYQISKKKKKLKESVCQEMTISFNIGKSDLKVKLEKIRKIIEKKGAMVKVKLVMDKRKVHPDLAQEKCQKDIIAELQKESPKIELRDDIRQHLGTFYFFLYKKKQ